MDGISIYVPLDMARPISEDLARLENEGVEMYDAQSQEKVFVVASLILIICEQSTCL